MFFCVTEVSHWPPVPAHSLQELKPKAVSWHRRNWAWRKETIRCFCV